MNLTHKLLITNFQKYVKNRNAVVDTIFPIITLTEYSKTKEDNIKEFREQNNSFYNQLLTDITNLNVSIKDNEIF